MNLYDLNSDNITMNIEGKDIEMKPAILYGQVYDKWLVSKCGKVWSWPKNRLLKPTKSFTYTGRLAFIQLKLRGPEGFWEDGSGWLSRQKLVQRHIKLHKMIMETWKPLYDNPPEGILWEEWEKVRDLPTVFDYISKTIVIDHIDDDPTNNHIDNLRRVTQWDNNYARKAKGI